MGQDGSEPPIKSKSAYLKLLFLKDMEKYKDQPLFYKPIRGTDESLPIYDSAVFYFFVLYGMDKPRRYSWEFTSAKGSIDDVFQLYPFDATKYNADPAKKNNLKVWDRIIIPKTDGVVVVAHYYNAFQRVDGEWAGARAEKDIYELRLTVDFSSIITAINKENLLFREKPAAFFVDEVEQTSKHVKLEYDSGKIFSAAINNAPEGGVLQFKWRLNWDNLGVWQASSHGSQITPQLLFEDVYKNTI